MIVDALLRPTLTLELANALVCMCQIICSAVRLAINAPTDPQTQVPGGIRHIFDTLVEAVSRIEVAWCGFAMTAHDPRELNGR